MNIIYVNDYEQVNYQTERNNILWCFDYSTWM